MSVMEDCAKCERLPPEELFLCATPSARHISLLASYRMNQKRGRKAVCDLIVGDLRRFIELGAQERAADLFLVLRLFLANCPKQRSVA